MQDFRIVSEAGLRVDLADLGARILDLQLPIEGQLVSVVCGYQNRQHYQHDASYVGATIGPIANRIHQGKLRVADRIIQLPLNQSGNCLHSAELGFNYQTWEVLAKTTSSLKLRLKTCDKLFGRLITVATFSVNGTALRVDYECTSELPNYINLSNHVYWNLNTNGEDINNHEFELLTVGYAEKDAHDIPTGVIVPLRTPFRYCPRTAGKTSQIDNAVDHHFFAQQNTQELNLTCIARSPQSGISLLVSSTKAGFQLYSGHFLTPPLSPYAGFCVEPQYAPNAINIAEFYSPLTTPESPYKHTIIYALSNS